MMKERMVISAKDIRDLSKLAELRVQRDNLCAELSDYSEAYGPEDEKVNRKIAAVDTKIRALEDIEYRVLNVLHLFYCEIQRVQRGDRFATAHEMDSIRGGSFEIFTGEFSAAQQALASMLSN